MPTWPGLLYWWGRTRLLNTPTGGEGGKGLRVRGPSTGAGRGEGFGRVRPLPAGCRAPRRRHPSPRARPLLAPSLSILYWWGQRPRKRGSVISPTGPRQRRRPLLAPPTPSAPASASFPAPPTCATCHQIECLPLEESSTPTEAVSTRARGVWKQQRVGGAACVQLCAWAERPCPAVGFQAREACRRVPLLLLPARRPHLLEGVAPQVDVHAGGGRGWAGHEGTGLNSCWWGLGG
jgi:hypothetical protein